MAWGSAASSPSQTASELLAKAQATGSIVVLPFRTFGDDEMIALCNLLATNASVSELKASGKAISENGAVALGRLLASGSCSLRNLAVGDTTFASTGCLRAIRHALEAAGASSCPLHVLDLGFKDLVGDDAVDLGAVLSHCPSLVELELARNPAFGASGIRALQASLASAACLTTLVLSETGLDGDALAALADAASSQPGALCAIRTLKLSSNPEVGDSAEVGRLVRSLRSLRCLHIQGCGLGAAAAASLGASLPSASALHELCLDDNPTLFESAMSVGSAGTFITSALPTRTDYEASLQLPHAERIALERSAAQSAAASASASDSGTCSLSPTASNATSLVAGLAACPLLATVGLGGCGLTDTHALELRRLCSAPSAPAAHLAEIDSRSNQLRVSGAAALLELPGLGKLSLFANPLVSSEREASGAESEMPAGEASAGGGAPRLAEAVTRAKSLRHLDLGACNLSVPALGALCAALSSGGAPRLGCLELLGNGDQHSVPAWKEALEALRAARTELDVAWKEPAN